MKFLFEMKQVGLLNVDGFYDSLLSFIDLAVDEGFISEEARRIIISASSAKELVRKLEVLIYIFMNIHVDLTILSFSFPMIL